MTDPSETPDPYRAAASRRAMQRLVRLVMNAFSIGLGTTALLAIAVLWLEKRSGVTLDGQQYRGLMGIMFLVITLSTYVVLEFFQQRDDAREARLAKTRKPRAPKRAAEVFEPIFAEVGQTAAPAAPAMPGLVPDAEPPPQPANAESLVPPAAGAAPFTATPAAAQNIRAALPPVDTATPAMFTQGVNAAVAALEEHPTPFVMFGVHLYVMGACGEAVRRGALPPDTGRALLIQMLKDMALSQRSAAAFAANANTFAQVPNFRGPIDAGYRAMAHLCEAGFVDLADVPEMLAQWQVQDMICKAPEPVTFVATSMGLPPPDAPPEDHRVVMRAHNKGMAAVMARFEGREVHNLGNGMIAAFTDAARAVRAAEGCQEFLDHFAAENPKLHVAPRIGVDTEMAAMVADTYISVAMTRAVTIAALTPAHHIYCTEATSDDAEAVVEFTPAPALENTADLPPLFIAVWSRMPARGGKALEYRQLGTMVDINPALSGSG